MAKKDETKAAEAAAKAAADEAPVVDDTGEEFGDAFKEFADAAQSTDGPDSGSGSGSEAASGSLDGGSGGDQAEGSEEAGDGADEGDDPGGAGDGAGKKASDDAEAASKAGGTGSDATGEGDDGDPKQGAEKTGANEADTADIWKGASPEQVEAFNKTQHENSSHKGRTASYERRIDSLTDELSTVRAGANASAKPTGNSNPSEVFDSDEWKAVEKQVPEIAGPLRTVVTSLQGTIDSQARQLATYSDDQRTGVMETNASYVDDAHEGWEDDLRTEGFANWFNVQPSHVQEGFRRNSQNIVDRVEAVELIDRFKASEFYTAPKSVESDTATNAAENKDKEDNPSAGNGKLARKRDRQLDGSAAVKNRGPGTTSGSPEDFEGAFEHYANKADKAAAG